MNKLNMAARLLKTSSSTSLGYVPAGIFFAHGSAVQFARKCVLLAGPRTIFLNLPTENIASS